MIYKIKYDRYPQRFNNGTQPLFDAEEYIEAEEQTEAIRKFVTEQKNKNCYEIIYKAKATLIHNEAINQEKAYTILILSNNADIYRSVAQCFKKCLWTLVAVLQGGKQND